MRVTRFATVNDATSERLWQVYRRAFAHLATEAVHRELLTREEFLQEMREPRLWKYVGFDPDEEPIAFATLTRHLETVEWINAEYFAARWPQEYAEGRVYYIGFIALDPDHQGQRRYRQILQPVVRTIAEARGVAGFDMCGYNVHVSEVLRNSMRAAGPPHVPDVQTLDTQTYFAVSFREADGVGPTRDGNVIDLTGTASGRPNR